MKGCHVEAWRDLGRHCIYRAKIVMRDGWGIIALGDLTLKGHEICKGSQCVSKKMQRLIFRNLN